MKKGAVILLILTVLICAGSFFLPELMLLTGSAELTRGTESVQVDTADLTFISKGLNITEKLITLSSRFSSSVDVAAPDGSYSANAVASCIDFLRSFYSISIGMSSGGTYEEAYESDASSGLLMDSTGRSFLIWYVTLRAEDFEADFVVDDETLLVLSYTIAYFPAGDRESLDKRVEEARSNITETPAYTDPSGYTFPDADAEVLPDYWFNDYFANAYYPEYNPEYPYMSAPEVFLFRYLSVDCVLLDRIQNTWYFRFGTTQVVALEYVDIEFLDNSVFIKMGV